MGACQSTNSNSKKINRDDNKNDDCNSKQGSKITTLEGFYESVADKKQSSVDSLKGFKTDQRKDYESESSEISKVRLKASNNIKKPPGPDGIKHKKKISEALNKNFSSNGTVLTDAMEQAIDNKIENDQKPSENNEEETGAFGGLILHYETDKNSIKLENPEVKVSDHLTIDETKTQELKDMIFQIEQTPLPKQGDEIEPFDKSRMFNTFDKDGVKMENSEVKASDYITFDTRKQHDLTDFNFQREETPLSKLRDEILPVDRSRMYYASDKLGVIMENTEVIAPEPSITDTNSNKISKNMQSYITEAKPELKIKSIEFKTDTLTLSESDRQIYELFLKSSKQNLLDPNKEMKKLITNELSLDRFASIMKSNKEGLIYHLIPFLVDNFRRRLDLKGFKEIFSKYNKQNKTSLKITNLSQRNLIEILLHVINTDSKHSISYMLLNFKYYLPLTFWKFNQVKNICEYQIEFPLLYTMVNVEKPIFFNFGLTNSIGKTEILFDLFNIDKNNLNISNGNGILREGTIDLYKSNDFLVFDLNHFSMKEKVMKITKEIINISSVVIIHFDYSTFKREVKSEKFKAMEPLIDPKKKLLVFIRNYDEDTHDEIDKAYMQKLFKNKIEVVEIFLIKNLTKINLEEKEHETSEVREKFKMILPKLKEGRKNFNSFIFEDNLTDFLNNRYQDCEFIENQFSSYLKNEKSQASPFTKLLKFSSEKYNIEKLERAKMPTNYLSLKKIDITKTFLQLFNELIIANDRNKLIALDSFIEKMTDSYLKPIISKRNKLLDSLIGMKFAKTKYTNEEKNQTPKENSDITTTGNNNRDIQTMTTALQEEISNLNEEIENNNISFDHFYSELYYYYDFYNSIEYDKGDLTGLFENLKKAYLREVTEGYPIHLIKNNSVSIHHQFLEEIFHNEYFRDKQYFIISILGMQSSAKSTLLNYLFGTDFKVSSGRCTRGIYASIIQSENTNQKIILLDTEGLSSIEGNDKLFDHQMALMCFGLSHLVLINHKGELSKNLQELLELSLYAMNYMSILNNSNPKIFFVLRDQIERDGEKHNTAMAKTKLQLQEIANKQNINLEDVMKIDMENLILLPSAFKENTENGVNIISPSNTFSKEVLKLRAKIFAEFELIKSANKLSNIQNFYNHACHLWTSFNKYGIDLLSCDSLREYEQKLEIIDKIKSLVESENKKLTKDINKFLEKSYDSIKTLSKLVDDQYELYITNLYNDSIQWIISEIEESFKNTRQYPQKIIDEGVDTIKDNMNLMKKHVFYFWKTKFMYLNRDIQTKQLQNEIKNRIEKEIEKILEYNQEEEEVLENLSNVTSDYKKKLIDNIHIPAIEEIKNSCFQTFNYCARLPFPKIKYSELDELDKINRKNWLHFKFNDNFIQFNSTSYNSREIKDIESEKINVLNEFEDFMKNLMQDMEKTEVVSDDKVKWYTTQIENFLKTDNSKNNFDRFNNDILYKDLSIIFISKLSEIIYENQNKKYIKEVSFITENISNIYKDSIDLFKTRKDNLKFSEKLAQSYLTDLFNNVKLIQSAQIISLVEKEFEDLPKDPEEFIRYAYEISFNRKNAKNIFKFVMNINKFLLEIFYELVKNKKENIIIIFKDKFESEIITKRKKFESLVNNFQIEIRKKGGEKFFLKEFNNKIAESADLSDVISVKNIYDKIENNLNDFCQIFLSSIRNFYADNLCSTTLLQSTFTEIEIRMNQFLEDKRNLIIGCQHVCPFCNSKCIKPAGEHSNHQAIHVINGFGGCKCVDNGEAILEYCLSKANLERKWRNPRDPTQFHKGIIEVCEHNFPDWVVDFKTNSKILSKDEEEKQLHSWFYVRKPICKYYGMKDNSNSTYLLDTNNILPEDFGQNY